MKLISTTQKALEIEKELDNISNEKLPIIKMIMCLDKIIEHAKFIDKYYKISHFVACDQIERPIKKPDFYYKKEDLVNLTGLDLEIALRVNEKAEEFKKANDKVIFEGFEISEEKGIKYIKNKDFYIYYFNNEKKQWQKINEDIKIKDLVKYNLTLTQQAINQIM